MSDLDELYSLRVVSKGRTRALVWYLRQALSFPLAGVRSGATDRANQTMRRTNNSVRRVLSMEVVQEARYSVRVLRRSPVFSLTVIGVLGLGMAGAITIFSLAYGVLLKPLPYHEPDRLVAIFTTDLGERDRSPSAPATVVDWRRDNSTVDQVTAAHPWSATFELTEPRRFVGLKATWPLFDLLSARPLLGRVWHSADSLTADDRVIVLRHSMWRREFGADSGIVGRTLVLNGEPYQVLGVMPDDFGFPPFWASEAEFWVPLDFGPEPSRRAQFVRVFGRMRLGVDVSQVQNDFTVMNRRLTEAYPDDLGGLGVLVEPLHEPVVSRARPVLLGLLGATLLLLLVAVANVANLMLGRKLARDREQAVRLALGAPRRRLVMQELGQSMLLSVVAGGLGVILAGLSIRVIGAMSLLGLPRASELSVDGVVVAVALALSVTIGLTLGSLSAMRRLPGAVLLRSSVGQSVRGSGWARDALVVAEVALAVMLLVGAGLTLRSLVRQFGIETGIETAGVLTMTIDMGGTTMFPPDGAQPFSGNSPNEVERQLAFFRAIVRRAEGLPGVESAGVTSHLPLAGDVWSTAVSRADRPIPANDERLTAATRNISPGYPATVGMRLLAGRSFDDWGWDSPDVIIVNRTLATLLWPAEDAVGRMLRLGSDLDDPVATVIAVVADVKQGTLVGEVSPEFYRPYGQNHFPWNRQVSLAVRTLGPPTAMAADLRAVIREVEPLAPVTDIRSMDDVVSEELFATRAATSLVGILAGFAVIVSTLGLFGVISFLVAQRRREFGIRMALGSSPGAVARLVLGRGSVLVVTGLVLGLAVSAIASGLVSSLLYQVPARDPVAFAGAALGLAAIGLVATWLPARWASRISPSLLMRTE
jgi:predicted permease